MKRVGDLGGELRPQLARVPRLLGQVGEADLGEAAVAEGRLSCEALVEDAAEGVNVALSRRLVALDQLWREVVRGAEDLAVGGEASRVRCAGEAEIGQRRSPAVEEHVRRLHVAVEDSLDVERVEPLAELRRKVEHFIHRRALERAQAHGERAPAVVRHDEVGEPV